MADAFLPYRHLKQIPAVAQVVFREFVKRNGVAAIRDISPHPPCVTIGGLPFPRTLVEAAVKRGELRKSNPRSLPPWSKKAPTLKEQSLERARVLKALGMAPEDGTASGRYAATTGELVKWLKEKKSKNPTHTQTCGTCRGKGCRRCGGQGWREKNPSATTKLHGLISKGQDSLRGKKNPREKMTKAELAKHQAYQVLGQHTSQCQQCAASYKTFGSFSHACPIGKALVQAASDKRGRKNPGRDESLRDLERAADQGDQKAFHKLFGEIKRLGILPPGYTMHHERGNFIDSDTGAPVSQGWLAVVKRDPRWHPSVGYKGPFPGMGVYSSEARAIEAARGVWLINWKSRHGWGKQKNPGFLTGAAVGLGAGAVAFTKRGRGLVASVARAGGRRTNPSFDYGSSFHEMALKSPARLSAETGASCKRCKGVGQVKLGPRMVSCPTCCRKAKKTDSSLTLQGVIRQISQEMGAARLSLRKIERQHGLDSIEWKVAAEKLAELSREHDQRVHQLRSKNLLSAKDLHTGDFDMQHYRARHDVRPHGAGRFDASGVMGVTSRQGTTEAFSSRPHKTSRAIGKLKGRSPLLSHKPNCACIYHAGKMGRKH